METTELLTFHSGDELLENAETTYLSFVFKFSELKGSFQITKAKCAAGGLINVFSFNAFKVIVNKEIEMHDICSCY